MLSPSDRVAASAAACLDGGSLDHACTLSVLLVEFAQSLFVADADCPSG